MVKVDMLKRTFHNLIFLICVICCFSCNNTKHLPKGESLYTGASISINGQDLNTKKRKVLTEDLQGLTRPKPNTKILGLRVKLALYNFAGDTSKKGFIRNFFRRLGEPPVLLSSLNLEKNVAVLQNHMENTGYFRGNVTGDTVVRRRRGHANYKIKSGPQYTINEVHFIQDSSGRKVDTLALFTAIREAAQKTLLKHKAPFNLNLVKGERTRIDAYLKERGFYFFSPDFIIVQVDSTIGGNRVNMYVNVKATTPPQALDIYHINNVFVYSNYSLNTAVVDTNHADASFYKGYYVVDKEKKFKPKVFEQALKFNPGDVYNRTDHNLSLARLINLGTFKFVKNRFEEVPYVDSPR